MLNSNYDKFPGIRVSDENLIFSGWKAISKVLSKDPGQRIIIDCYHGVYLKELESELRRNFPNAQLFCTERALKSSDELNEMLESDLTDDRVFGRISQVQLSDYFDADKRADLSNQFEQSSGQTILFGIGANIISEDSSILIYADMARWEIQTRFRKGDMGNIGISNFNEDFLIKYKRGYFADWRACDRHKQNIFRSSDYILDLNKTEEPKLISTEHIIEGFEKCIHQPFRVVPFFDPGPWGGQWMKEVCDLDRSVENFAWCFDCVPEENSLYLEFGSNYIELPSIDLVFFQPKELLGNEIFNRFGAEFPIRFDFLDTMDGGNLSLQVHPLTEYIREQFGMSYTQDESYYLLDAKEDAFVYLGLKNETRSTEMVEALNHAQNGGSHFPAEKFVNKIKIKKHDHVLIPAGTVHCSGKDSMVLEISATPYIFTFKLWDWGRLGLDGRPRPIHLDHGKNVIQWDRQSEFVQDELMNVIEKIDEGDGWVEERTGLHALEFIETRRHWFENKVEHDTQGNLNVLNLVEGREAIVESPTGEFMPFIVHYAETFIVPARIGKYTISPYGESVGTKCGTIKAFVRTQMNHNGKHKI